MEAETDRVGARVDALVLEACALVHAVDTDRATEQTWADLSDLRVHLLVAAQETDDRQACDAACGTVEEVDRAVAMLGFDVWQRGAA